MVLTEVLPNNYRRNNKASTIKVIDGFPFNFFINHTLTTQVFANLRLSVFDGYGTEVISDVAPLSQLNLGGGDYKVYAEDVEIIGLNNHYNYDLIIYDTSDSSIVFFVSCFQFIQDSEAGNYVRLSYRNSSNRDGFNYEELPAYRHIVYLELNKIDAPAEYEIKEYFEASTGISRMQKSQLKDSVILEAFKFDDDMNQAMKSLSLHDDININFEQYQTKSGYEIDTDIRDNRSKGTIELYVQENNEINLNL